MKPIALFFVVTAGMIETIAFGWIAVEFWPDTVLVAVAIGALLVCLAMTIFTGWIIDRRLRQIEDERDGRASVVDRM